MEPVSICLYVASTGWISARMTGSGRERSQSSPSPDPDCPDAAGLRFSANGSDRATPATSQHSVRVLR